MKEKYCLTEKNKLKKTDYKTRTGHARKKEFKSTGKTLFGRWSIYEIYSANNAVPSKNKFHTFRLFFSSIHSGFVKLNLLYINIYVFSTSG